MKVTQQFVDNLCCRLKLIGAPKVSWLQTGFLIFGNQLKLNLLPNLRWFIFKLCFFSTNKVLLFAVLLIIWTDIPIAKPHEDFLVYGVHWSMLVILLY